MVLELSPAAVSRLEIQKERALSRLSVGHPLETPIYIWGKQIHLVRWQQLG